MIHHKMSLRDGNIEVTHKHRARLVVEKKNISISTSVRSLRSDVFVVGDVSIDYVLP